MILSPLRDHLTTFIRFTIVAVEDWVPLGLKIRPSSQILVNHRQYFMELKKGPQKCEQDVEISYSQTTLEIDFVFEKQI